MCTSCLKLPTERGEKTMYRAIPFKLKEWKALFGQKGRRAGKSISPVC